MLVTIFGALFPASFNINKLLILVGLAAEVEVEPMEAGDEAPLKKNRGNYGHAETQESSVGCCKQQTKTCSYLFTKLEMSDAMGDGTPEDLRIPLLAEVTADGSPTAVAAGMDAALTVVVSDEICCESEVAAEAFGANGAEGCLVRS